MSIDSLYSSEAAHAWGYFAELSKLPRPSKHEINVQNWLIEIANKKGLNYKQDEVGNITIQVPGKGQLKDADPLILQGHMDMVCEKNADKEHDFYKDPIELSIDGDWLIANDTTLGADNGVAIAFALGLIDEDLDNHCPLELLFTIDEETGLTGALNLDPKILDGKKLLNLDSEEDGVFTIGCAGGIDLDTHFQRQSTTVDTTTTIKISGLRGGHSGVNINEDRASAIRIAAEFLVQLKSKCDVEVIDFTAGNKKNAIPREAEFTISQVDETILRELIDQTIEAYQDAEPGIEVFYYEGDAATSIIPFTAIEYLAEIPFSVIKMDPDFEHHVQTSNSIGVVLTEGDTFKVLAHGRSSSGDEIDWLIEQCSKLSESKGGSFIASERYPGWQPNAESILLKDAVSAYESFFGEKPKVESIHAGLESGIIGDKIKSNELLSYGPTIENAHSPEERLSIASFEAAYRFLKYFISRV